MIVTSSIFSLACAFLLTMLQVIFGFLLKRHREAFLKYHRALGVIIFLVVLANVVLFPLVYIIGIVTLLAVAAQIVIGALLIKNKALKKYHQPLGALILILIITNIVMALALS